MLTPEDACLWIALAALAGHVPGAMALLRLQRKLADQDAKD